MDGQELRQRRKTLNLTQSELADRLGLSKAFVGMMERGDKPIAERTAAAVERLTFTPLERRPTLKDPLERLIESALIDAGIEYETDQGGGNKSRLDFYLPRYDLSIEVKRFYSARAGEQLARAANVILLQGEPSCRAFAALIRNGGFSALEFDMMSRHGALKG